VTKFAQGFLFELRKSGNLVKIVGNSIAGPNQAKLRAVAKNLMPTIKVRGTQQLKSPIGASA
jgi:hypothetical protein